MNSYDNGNAYRQPKLSSYPRWAVGAGALLLAILLGYVDAAVLSGVRSSNVMSEMVVPMRVAALLTVAVVLLAVGAVASFLGAFRQNTAARGEEEGREQVSERLDPDEMDVFNVRSDAA